MEDRHHLLHYAKEWSLRPPAKKLRETPSLVPVIERSLHQEIHANCPPVPLLGYHALQRVARSFEPTRDTLSSIENLMFAIQDAGKHPRAHSIERQLGLLTIEAIAMQREYLWDYRTSVDYIDLGRAM